MIPSFSDIATTILKMLGITLGDIYFHIYEIFLAIMFFIISYKIIKVVYSTVYSFFLSIAKKTKGTIDDILLEHLKNPFFMVLVFALVYWILEGMDILQKYDSYLKNIYFSFVAIIIGWFLYGFSSTFVENYLNKFVTTHRKIETTVISLTTTIIKGIIWVIVGLEILAIWNISLSPLLASAGILGVILGFAAQETMKNLFGGISLAMDKTLKVGDWVVIDNHRMKVFKLGLRATQFLTLDNTLKIYPNSYLSNTIIENLNEPRKEQKKIRLTIGVAYGSNPDKVKEVLIDEAKKIEKINPDSVSVFMVNLGAYSIDFLLVCEVPTIDDVPSVKRTLIENIYKRLNKENIEIPFPTNTVYLKKEKGGKENE